MTNKQRLALCQQIKQTVAGFNKICEKRIKAQFEPEYDPMDWIECVEIPAEIARQEGRNYV